MPVAAATGSYTAAMADPAAESIAPLSAARQQLWLPRLSLAACIRAVMVRDTRGVALTDLQRFNHFPASPLCAISWWFSGSSEQVLAVGPGHEHLAGLQELPRQPMPGRVVFSGPHTVPTTSWCPGEVHGMMLMLLPDAVHALTGLAPEQFVNRLVAAETVLPPAWLAWCDAVQQAPDDEQRVQRIEDFLDPLWQQVRPRQALAAHRYADWAQGLMLRAAASGPGRSLRQVERRIKRWAGLPMRELQGISRAERMFFQVLAAEQAGELRWAELAVDGGYTDQSHLCRATRRVTGFAPEALRRGIERDERFWAYRLWA